MADAIIANIFFIVFLFLYFGGISAGNAADTVAAFLLKLDGHGCDFLIKKAHLIG